MQGKATQGTAEAGACGAEAPVEHRPHTGHFFDGPHTAEPGLLHLPPLDLREVAERPVGAVWRQCGGPHCFPKTLTLN